MLIIVRRNIFKRFHESQTINNRKESTKTKREWRTMEAKRKIKYLEKNCNEKGKIEKIHDSTYDEIVENPWKNT